MPHGPHAGGVSEVDGFFSSVATNYIGTIESALLPSLDQQTEIAVLFALVLCPSSDCSNILSLRNTLWADRNRLLIVPRKKDLPVAFLGM